MHRKTVRAAVTLAGVMTLAAAPFARAQDAEPYGATVVRIAELVIDPAQLEAYQAAVREEMAESVRVEPGVTSIYAVALKDHPNHIRFFEIYASDAAYQSHIRSPHFLEYVRTTQHMIKSRVLLEAVPVQLSTNPRPSSVIPEPPASPSEGAHP